MDSLVSGEGSFFDPIADALQKTIGIYSQIEAIKLNNQLAKAKASADNYNTPTPTQDAQARAQSAMTFATDNRMWIIGAAVLVGAAALYVIVK